jgi:hypothetical protein
MFGKKLFSFACCAIVVAACNKPAEAPAAAPTAPVPAPAPAEAPKPVPPPAPVSPTAAPAPAALEKVLTDVCPMPGEDPAACPVKPATVDDNIKVAHVLVGWEGSLPGKPIKRTKDEALTLAKEIAHEARKPGNDFIGLVWKHSDDNGPGVYDLTPNMRGRYVPQFTAMALSLGVGQVDIVPTRFGFHVMKRVPFDFTPPEKPLMKILTDVCPAAGEDPATCPTEQTPKPTKTTVSHILIGYMGSLPGENVTLTKDEARKKAIEIAHQARKKGADFGALMKANSKDPGPGTYPVDKDAQLVPPFKQLGLSLGKGQVDIVETSFGFHVMKRVE